MWRDGTILKQANQIGVPEGSKDKNSKKAQDTIKP